MHPKNPVVVSPDIGSIKLARPTPLPSHYVCQSSTNSALSSKATEVVALIGDVKGKDVLLADDMCSTGSTLVSAAKACQEKGVKNFCRCDPWPVCRQIGQTGRAKPYFGTVDGNTIPQTDRLNGFTKLHQVSVASHFAHAIQCILSKESISSL